MLTDTFWQFIYESLNGPLTVVWLIGLIFFFMLLVRRARLLQD